MVVRQLQPVQTFFVKKVQKPTYKASLMYSFLSSKCYQDR